MTSLADHPRLHAQVLAAVAAVRPQQRQVHEGDSLSGLGIDSLDRLALAVALEQVTGREVPDHVLAGARTVADLLALLMPTAAASATSTRSAPVTPTSHADSTDISCPRSQAGLGGTGWADEGAHTGDGTRLWHQAQIAPGASVGTDCTLGKGAFVGTGSIVGDRVKIGNYACLFGAVVDDEAMICPGALLLEDPAPRATTPEGLRKGPADFTRRPVTVRRGATVGAAAVLAPGITVGAHALVAVAAVVVRDVPAHALVAGNPARQCGWVCHCGHTLDDTLRCPDCPRTYTPDGDQLTARDTGSAQRR